MCCDIKIVCLHVYVVPNLKKPMLAYISSFFLVCYHIQQKCGYSTLSHHIDVFTIANAVDQLDVSNVKASPDG